MESTSVSDLVIHIPGFINKNRAEFLLNALQALLPWTSFAPSPKSRKVWRSEGPTGDQTIDTIFLELTKDLQQHCGGQVQGIFCNLYETGEDYCPYHKDQYGCNVWTLSLGDARDFLVKKDGTGTKADTYNLKSGDLYFMDNRLHKTHRHSIPTRKSRKGSRISVVFFTN